MANSKKPKKLTRSSLVAKASPQSTPAIISFVFSSGLGQATTSLFRNGVLINMQKVLATPVTSSLQMCKVEMLFQSMGFVQATHKFE
jgi:hypothetical protein